MSFNFSTLNLSDVNGEQGRRSLEAGDHVCTITDAEMKETRNGGSMLVIELTGDTGQSVRDRINLANANPKTVEMGRARLKHLLEMANHPTPDKPQNIASMRGLHVGVHVVDGDDWTDANGMIRRGGGEPRNVAPYFHATGSEAAPTAGETFGDDIPF
jgi:hypothetical protein